jgi:hypothetical protein
VHYLPVTSIAATHIDCSILAGLLETVPITTAAAVLRVAAWLAAALGWWRRGCKRWGQGGAWWQRQHGWWGHLGCWRRCHQGWVWQCTLCRRLVDHTTEGGVITADITGWATAEHVRGASGARDSAAAIVAAGGKVHGDGNRAGHSTSCHGLLHTVLGQHPGHAAVQRLGGDVGRCCCSVCEPVEA